MKRAKSILHFVLPGGMSPKHTLPCSAAVAASPAAEPSARSGHEPGAHER
jgi:hypothetical protein